MRPRKPTYMQHGVKVGLVDCFIVRADGKELLCSGEIYQLPWRTEYHWQKHERIILDGCGGAMQYVETYNEGATGEIRSELIQIRQRIGGSYSRVPDGLIVYGGQ